MSNYNPNVIVYYREESNRLAPAPTISISPEIYYSNDNPIGYTYNVTLNGYANALRKELNAGSTNYGLEPVLDHIGDIREIFNTNGGNLYIKSNGDTIVAKGATIKNLQFNPSDNKWVNYAQYSIELEFNEIDFIGCSGNSEISCLSSIFHEVADGTKNINNNIVDLTKYKIKDFTDKWNFNIDDRIYDNYSDIYNNVFDISYTISATGKNYYVDGTLVPAYQQAKLFAQNRLRNQINSLINGVLQIQPNNQDSCGSAKDLTQIYNTSASGGIFEGFSDTIYQVYNEKIDCDTSESDGTFSLTYSAIAKKYNPSISVNANAIIHTYSVDNNVSTDGNLQASFNVKGTVQGLVRGGFIKYDTNDYQLPASGQFIVAQSGNETKYSNALSYYAEAIGTNSDLLVAYKNKIGINNSGLLINNNNTISPSSFTLDHNYHDGTVSYTAAYDRAYNIAKNNGYANISIVRNDPVEIIQEFVVPGRSGGPIIQKLNMKTARTITINIDGASDNNKICSINDLCNYLPTVNISGLNSILQERADVIKTREDYTSNPIDGSFSISLEYTAKV